MLLIQGKEVCRKSGVCNQHNELKLLKIHILTNQYRRNYYITSYTSSRLRNPRPLKLTRKKLKQEKPCAYVVNENTHLIV
jgi:hypothetical protein